MDQLPIALPNSPLPRRRGRPPGARSKRSLDLARYIEATFGGMTPGQQAAAIALVTPKELAGARRAAAELGIVHPETMQPLLLAQIVKAKQLARALGCEPTAAWLLLQKEREALLPYVHQKRPAAPAEKEGAAAPTMYVVDQRDLEQAPAGGPGSAGDADADLIEEFDAPEREVGQAKSDEDA